MVSRNRSFETTKVLIQQKTNPRPIFRKWRESRRGLELGPERCPGALDPAVVQHFSHRFRKSAREVSVWKNEAGQAPRNYPLTYLTEINSKQAPSGTVNGKLILQKYMSVGNYFSTMVIPSQDQKQVAERQTLNIQKALQESVWTQMEFLRSEMSIE